MATTARLTQLEWWALCAAAAERAENLADRQDRGERLGKERAALDRALDKVRAGLAPPDPWDTSRR